MPLSVQPNRWSQTGDTVVVEVALKGARKDKLNITSSDVFVRLSFGPYVCEIDLYAPVDDSRSQAVVEDGIVRMTLYKQTAESWPQLAAEGWVLGSVWRTETLARWFSQLLHVAHRLEGSAVWTLRDGTITVYVLFNGQLEDESAPN